MLATKMILGINNGRGPLLLLCHFFNNPVSTNEATNEFGPLRKYSLVTPNGQLIDNV